MFKFDGSCMLVYHIYRKNVIISIEALIYGYFEPKKLRTRPLNKADMTS